jgi:outer membrane biosynthesis protein TonB
VDSSTQSGPNYYEALGLTPEASEDDIRSAFKALNRKQRERDRELLDEARRTSIAFETLRDQAKRHAYDASLGGGPEQNGSATSLPHPERRPADQSQLQTVVAPQGELASTGLRRPSLAGNASRVLTVGEHPYVFPRERSHSWMAVAGVVLGAMLIVPVLLWQNSGNSHRNPAALSEPILPDVIRDPLAEDEPLPTGLLPEEPAVPARSTEQSGAEPDRATPPAPTKVKTAKPRKTEEPAPQKKKSEAASHDDAAKSARTSAKASAASEHRTSTAPETIKHAIPPRWIVGGLMDSDNRGGQFSGAVSVRYTVKPSGQVRNCRPVVSSGNPALDGRTCRLLEQRLLYSPALDTKGRPVATELGTTYVWRRGGR